MSDAIRGATSPKSGARPTPGQAWRAARQSVTGHNPKRRSPTRRAIAGVVAGATAAALAKKNAATAKRRADKARALKAKRAAEAQAAKIRARRRGRVQTSVPPQAGTTPNTATKRVPAPAPIPKGRKTMPPRQRATTPATNGSGSSAAALLAASEDFLAAALRDAPDGMLQVVAEAHMFPVVLENLAKAMFARFEKANEMPFSPVIKDLYAAIHAASCAVQRTAEDVGPLIERIHRDDLERLRNPRANERMWDVAANRDY